MSGNLISRCKSVVFIVLLTALPAVSWAQQDIIDTAVKSVPANTVKKDSLEAGAPAQNGVEQKKFLPPARVIEIYNAKYPDAADKRYRQAGIGDIIVVQVANLDSLIRRSQCKDVAGNALNGCQQQKIGLFINGRLITNIFPLSGAPQRLGNTNIWKLQYQLERNGDNDDIWANILGSPPLFSDLFFIKPVNISVGLQNEYAIETTDNAGSNNFNFVRIHRDWFWTCFAGIILYIVLLVYLTRKRRLLSDRNIDLSSIGIPNNDNPTYSLARFQMAFWFSLFIISFLFIWLITDAYDIITTTVLALIGISAGTSLSALVIDNSKKTDLLTKTVSLQQKINDPAVPEDQKLLLRAEFEANKKKLQPVSDGFFNDLLTDANGISFHRLQMLVWTIVLGLIFVYSVWKKLSMPDFDSTLLALQGLTSGTYLGFKFPERQS